MTASPPLFVPSTRFVGSVREQHPEVDLGVTVEGFREHEITSEDVEAFSAYEDLPTSVRGDSWKQVAALFLCGGLVWLGTDVFLTTEDSSSSSRLRSAVGYSKHCTFASSCTTKCHVWASPSAAHEDIALACSLFLRLMEASGTTLFIFKQTSDIDDQCVISGPTLSRFLIECTSLETFLASDCTFCEPHVRAMSDASSVRPELEIILSNFCVTPVGKVALAASLQQNYGPTDISTTSGELDYRFFVDALPGNTRLARLDVFPCNVNSNIGEDIAAFVRSFSRNKGLKKLKLNCVPLSGENWGLFCEALPEHPALTSLVFHKTGPSPTHSLCFVEEEELPEATKVFRVQQVAELLQKNKVLTDVDLNFRHTLIATEIEPRLRINRHRKKLKAVTKAPYAWRRQLAGRAVDVVREDPTLQFMLLVQSADVLFFGGGEEEERNAIVVQEETQAPFGCWPM